MSPEKPTCGDCRFMERKETQPVEHKPIGDCRALPPRPTAVPYSGGPEVKATRPACRFFEPKGDPR